MAQRHEGTEKRKSLNAERAETALKGRQVIAHGVSRGQAGEVPHGRFLFEAPAGAKERGPAQRPVAPDGAQRNGVRRSGYPRPTPWAIAYRAFGTQVQATT